MRLRRMVARLVPGVAAVAVLAGCGSSNFGSTFNAVVPTQWTLVSSSGKISNNCSSGANCGNVSRTYQMNEASQRGVSDLAGQLQSRGCTAQIQGNGLSSDCPTGVHLAVSFTDTEASMTLTKNAG